MRVATLTLALWAHGGLSVLPDANLFKADIGNRVVRLAELGDFGLQVIASNASSLSSRDGDDILNNLLPRQSCSVGHLCPNGQCCKDYENCVPGGCCNKPEVQCGSDKCYNPDKSTCCSSGTVCDKGWVCVEGGGCCPEETPQRCGNSDRCYDPKKQRCCTEGGKAWGCDASSTCCQGGFCRTSSEQCCANGSCALDTTCCEKQCCKSIGFCGSDGLCEPCPAATRTRSEEATVTVTRYHRRVRGGPDTKAAPPFSCLPITATNEVGATLELGDDCKLEYAPPEEEPTSTEGVAARGLSAPTAAPRLQARQGNCVPWTTMIEYTTSTTTTTAWATTTAEEGSGANGRPQGNVEFSCPEMEVTNALGDTLAMDETCGLEFTAAEATGASDGGGGSDGSGGGGGGDAPAQGEGGSPNAPGSGAGVASVAMAAWAVMGAGVLFVWF
ncbi:hypothetical protein F5X68DRAFT_279523 [Plectosphaerella plurivora]|uniref:GPI anchored protein n=1 Tax=Plectosphaerella plurivora TaxID=936078 RepID=A0A9P8V1L9_9PEZI|nr:hypothetical protein F5X68DRAFT_279523 [Plectosphaerella plurivora]